MRRLGIPVLAFLLLAPACSDSAPDPNNPEELFQQATIDSFYEPYGFVAHALGTVNGIFGSNSRDAFEESYQKGFRVFEVDLVRLADGTVLAAHDMYEPYYDLDKPFNEATRQDVEGLRFFGFVEPELNLRYEVMTGEDLIDLMKEYPDAYLITDTKSDHVEILRTLVGLEPGPEVLERLIPHIQDQEDLDQLHDIYPFANYMLALYRTQWLDRFDDDEVIDFVTRNDIGAVMMWWRDRDPEVSLSQNNLQQQRFTSEFAHRLQASGVVVYVHSLNEPSDIEFFRSLGVGVYLPDE